MYNSPIKPDLQEKAMKPTVYSTPTDRECYYRIATKNFGANNNVEDTSAALQVNCCGEAFVESKDYRGGYRPGRRDFYLIYMQGGEMLGTIDGRAVCLERGSVVCMSPRTPCAFRATENMSEPITYYWIHFTGAEAESAVRLAGITLGEVKSIGISTEVLSHFAKLFEEFRLHRQAEGFDYSSGVELRYILHLIGKALSDSSEGRLDTSLKYIHAHVGEELSVERLASMEFLGVSRFREVFREITGLSPSEYITALRMARAKDLLAETNSTVAEIAYLTGYRDGPYFQRVFKLYEGVTPGEYRRQLRKAKSIAATSKNKL